MAQEYTFGYSEFTTWPWPFARDLERYKAHGAGVLEVCEFKLAHNDYRAQLEDAAKAGLQVASVQAKVHSVFVDSMAPVPKDPADRIAAIENAIELSAPYLPEGTPFVVITGIPPEGNFRKAIDLTADALRRLGDFAAKRGMKIAFEPLSPVNIHTDTAVWGLDQGLELVRKVNHPAVGICIDTWNVWQTPDLERTIAECGERILLVQLSDWKTPRSTADRYVLGTGEIPLTDIVRAIRKTGYEGAWIVELLSSLHLENSLWKSDMDEMLRANCEAFARIWQLSQS